MGDHVGRRIVGLAAAVAVALLAAAATQVPNPASAEGATLTATPDTIVVDSAEVTATVTLTNGGVTPLRAINLSSTINGSARYEVQLDPVGTQGRALPPKGILAWRATIRPVGEPGTAVIWFRADFVHDSPAVDAASSTRPTLEPPVPGVATTSIGLSAGGLKAAVEVQGGSGDLTDRRARPLELLVTNEGAAPIDAIVIPHPDDMVVVDPPESKSRTISPSATEAFSFAIKAADSIVPGERTLLFDVDLTAGGQGRRIVASHVVTLGVLGDAQINALLGIPVFFLVPGTILLIVWQLIGGFFGRLTPRNLPTFEKKDFWVLAIGLSLLLAPLYGPFTGLLARLGLIPGGARDYLVGYGTLDVLIVWATAFMVPALLYTVGRATKAVLRRHEIDARDSPLKVLEKIGKARGSLARRQVEVDGRTAFLLEDRPREEHYWIGPQIEVEWLESVDPTEEQAARQQLQADGDVGLLEATLKRSADAGHALVRFIPNGPLTGPAWVALTELKFGTEELLVRGT